MDSLLKPSSRASRPKVRRPSDAIASRIVSEILSPTQSTVFDFPVLKKGSTRKFSAKTGLINRHTNTRACKGFIWLYCNAWVRRGPARDLTSAREVETRESVREDDFLIRTAEANLFDSILAIAILISYGSTAKFG